MSYNCDICGIGMQDAGKQFSTHRVMTSPGYWEFLCNDQSGHPWNEMMLGGHLMLTQMQGDGFGVCPTCSDMLCADPAKVREYGLQNFFDRPDPAAAATVAGTVWERKRGKWPASIEADFRRARTSTSGCFIATAAMGTSSADEVAVLCAFRDRWLLSSCIGALIVKAYCRLSPPVARSLEQSRLARYLVRWLLIAPLAKVLKVLQVRNERYATRVAEQRAAPDPAPVEDGRRRASAHVGRTTY